jgi:hypothetical protein
MAHGSLILMAHGILILMAHGSLILMAHGSLILMAHGSLIEDSAYIIQTFIYLGSSVLVSYFCVLREDAFGILSYT